MYLWNGPPSDQKVSSFPTVHVYPATKPKFPPKTPPYAEQPYDVSVTSLDKHNFIVRWKNSYAPNTNHYGKILFRFQKQGQGAQQWDIDNGYTESFTYGPWDPNSKYTISVKGGYSYGTGYGYSK